MLDRPVSTTEPPSLARRGLAPRMAGGSQQSALTGTAILAILRRRKLALLGPMLLVPLLTWLLIIQFIPLYTATGTLLYDASEYKLRELQSILRVDPITDAVMLTQAEVLRGMPVVEQVADRLNLHANPEFNVALRSPSWLARVTAAARQLLPGLKKTASPDRALFGPNLDPIRNATLEAVRGALIVTPVKSSHVLQVSFTAADPVLAAAAANHAMDVYVKSQLSAKFGAVMRAREWLEQRTKELREDVRRREDDIASYRADHGLIEGMHARLESEQISLLTENLARARSALAEASGRLDAASGRAGANAQAAIAPSVLQLRTQQGQLAAQLQSTRARLGPSHPDIQGLRAQLAEAERSVAAEMARVVAAIEADVNADRERVAVLEQNLREARSDIALDAQAQVPLNAKQRDAEASRSLLQAVLDRMQQTAQQSAIEAPDAHEISLALAPEQPSFPRTVPLMTGASAFGVMLGLLLMYVVELADTKFHSGEDIRTVLGLPCFALIPRISARVLGRVPIEEYAARKPLSPFAEQLRALRAGLSHCPDRPRIVAITAARSSEGKTTVTQALGRLAAMSGERIIVLDCDINRSGEQPTRDAAPGLADCLQERASLKDVIQKDTRSGMSYIPAGTADANASGLLTSATMARLLQTLRQECDLVLLDAPPAQAVTDARIVAGLADATVLCIRWRDTPRDKVLNALELLEEAHANVVGAVLTQVDVNVHVRSGYADAEVYHPRYGKSFRE
jgi:polysaccharide biosynthesis transport protein